MHASAPLDPLTLAVDLVNIDSTTGCEGPVVSHLEMLLRSRDWQVSRIPVSANRDCLLAVTGMAPIATLSAHLDTVPPFLPSRIENGRLYGRGACDAKGIAAAMICAAELLRGRGVAVALLFVIGEETIQDGARAANASPLSPTTSRILLNGEPTGNVLASGTKGVMAVKLKVSGTAAHSAYPELGDSAITKLAKILSDLDESTFPSMLSSAGPRSTSEGYRAASRIMS